jgi:hypothetical protein
MERRIMTPDAAVSHSSGEPRPLAVALGWSAGRLAKVAIATGVAAVARRAAPGGAAWKNVSKP